MGSEPKTVLTVDHRIAAVAQAIQGTTAGACEIRKSAQELSQMAVGLQQLVMRFNLRVTAADRGVAAGA